MARIGAFCFPGTGHLNPMMALARSLEQRGHSLVLFGIADVESKVRVAGIEFRLIGEEDYPPGTLLRLDQQLGEQRGMNVFRFTVERVKKYTRMILHDAPDAVRDSGAEVLLVDEADPSGTVADFLRLPFVSIACFPPLLRSDLIPPFVFGWKYSAGAFGRLRNRVGGTLLSRFAAPVLDVLNEQRRVWGLPMLRHASDMLSPLAQITQLPAALEFPLSKVPSPLHYTGPFVDAGMRQPVSFPWERLDGRPLIYASLGTLQNRMDHVFRMIAEACKGLDAQLVISLGGGIRPEDLGPLAGDPLVVGYAPQLEVLGKAAAVITHAGLNTTLEALAEGIPLVAIPLGNDQPGVAARIAYRNVGVVVPLKRLSVNRLRRAVQTVLRDGKYRRAAQRIQAAIREIDALKMASDLIEDAFGFSRSAAASALSMPSA
ncbi:glycosyltransferase [Alloacidobacterium dinghuense]|uniref:Glycosyltransferase n=1 Tax=Alloacidobacterium dinghuense TaxID=2763107 RepID=A0A7G8BNB8_9BACT|nr:glycosyltransferase [Alloacidobacterium dinghuense]QNI34038.1 glycosyltransferase [Alloacidobacterium dinghuense]